MTSTILPKNLWNKKFFRIFSYGSATLILGLFGKVDLSFAQSQLQVKTNRYLQVEQVRGKVFYVIKIPIVLREEAIAFRQLVMKLSQMENQQPC
jgi:hypothetical protein